MDPLREPEPADMTDRQLRALAESLERRRPPVRLSSMGARPDRRPWTYRDIWRLEAARAEMLRRGLP